MSRAAAGVREQPGTPTWLACLQRMVGGRMPLWPIVLVLCAGREVMCGKKRGKGVGGKGVEQVVSERGSNLNKFLGGTHFLSKSILV